MARYALAIVSSMYLAETSACLQIQIVRQNEMHGKRIHIVHRKRLQERSSKTLVRSVQAFNAWIPARSLPKT